MARQQTVSLVGDRKPPAAASRHERPDLLAGLRLAYTARHRFESIPAGHVNLMCYIAYKDGDGKGCFATIETIRRETGVGRDQIQRAIKELNELGLISVQRQPRGPNTLRLMIGPKEVQEDAIKPTQSSGLDNSIKGTSPLNQGGEHTQQHTHEPNPVGLVGSCVNPGERVLALDGGGRVIVHTIKASSNKDPGGAARADFQGGLITVATDETRRSLRENKRAKAWNLWIHEKTTAAEPLPIKVLGGKGLLAFAQFVMLDCWGGEKAWKEGEKIPPGRVTKGWIDKQFEKPREGGWVCLPHRNLVVRDGKVAYRRPEEVEAGE